jgi:hypothetical protein
MLTLFYQEACKNNNFFRSLPIVIVLLVRELHLIRTPGTSANHDQIPIIAIHTLLNNFNRSKNDIMYRYFFRFAVMSLTILTVNLITNAITTYMVSYKNYYKPVTFTLAGMAILVVIFYPLFIKLESWVRSLSVKAIKTGNSAAGKFFGLLITFLAALLVLLYFYTKMWFHINIFDLLIH